MKKEKKFSNQIKAIKKSRNIIAIERDKLREIYETVQEDIEDWGESIDYLDNAIDVLSKRL